MATQNKTIKLNQIQTEILHLTLRYHSKMTKY